MSKRMYTFDLNFSVEGKTVQDAVKELHALLLEKGLDEANPAFHVLSEDDDTEFDGTFDDFVVGDTTNTVVEFTWAEGERAGQPLKEAAFLWAE